MSVAESSPRAGGFEQCPPYAEISLKVKQAAVQLLAESLLYIQHYPSFCLCLTAAGSVAGSVGPSCSVLLPAVVLTLFLTVLGPLYPFVSSGPFYPFAGGGPLYPFAGSGPLYPVAGGSPLYPVAGVGPLYLLLEVVHFTLLLAVVRFTCCW